MPVTDTKKSADLETRIADAFDAKMTAQQLSALLSEVESASVAATVSGATAKEVALNPSTRADALAAARKKMEDAEFRQQRMERAKASLTALRDEAIKRERDEAAAKELNAALKERDQIVSDLAEYETLSEQMATLLERLSANNRRLGSLPSAEWFARAPETNGQLSVRQASLLVPLIDGVRLPKFKTDDSTIHGYLWPKP